MNNKSAMASKTCSFLIFLGIILGVSILAITTLPLKWLIVYFAAGFFSVVLFITRSLNRVVLFLLILSLTMKIDFYLGYSEAFETVKPGVPISLSSIVLILAYAVWAVRIALKLNSVKFFPSVTIPFGLLVVWSCLSLLTASRYDYALSQIPGVLTAFLIYFYAANILNPPKDISFLVKSLAICIALNSAMGLLQYTMGTSFNLKFLGESEALLEQQYSLGSMSRVSGFLLHPNHLALFLNGTMPLLFLGMTILENHSLRHICFIAFTLALLALMATYSRGGWLTFILSALVITVFAFRRAWRDNHPLVHRYVILTALIGVLALAPFYAKIQTRLIGDDYGAAYSRIPLAKRAINAIVERPLSGVGLGNYIPVIADRDPNRILDEYGQPLAVHNMFLYLTAELGLTGLAFFIIISIGFFKKGLVSINQAEKLRKIWALSMTIGLGAIYFHGLFENISLGHPIFVLVAFIGGCQMALRDIKKSNKNPCNYSPTIFELNS